MLKTSSIAALSGFFLVAPTLGHAECPAIGVPIVVAQTGEVIVTMERPDNPNVAYTDSLYLESHPVYADILPIITNKPATPTGTQISLGTFSAGTELVFRLHAQSPSGAEFDFFTGSESRNLDGEPHAALSSGTGGETIVQFEDTLNNKECPDQAGAFTDFKFSVSNVQTILSPDRFLSYKAKPAKVSKMTIPLTDAAAAGSYNVTLTKKASLANPVKIGDTEIVSADPSLAGYTVKGPKRKAKFNVSNELGSWVIATKKVDRLFVPAAADRSSVPDAPTLDNQGIADIYACYQSKVTKGSKSLNRKVRLQDELNTSQREYTLKAPSRLCIPADQGVGKKRPDTYLMCYSAVVKGKPTRVNGINVHDTLLGTDQTTVIKQEEYCVPSSASKL